VLTGVAGITASSPALSAAVTGRLVFSVFEHDGHAIYVLDPDNVVAMVPPPASSRAALIAGRTTPGGDVQRFLSDPARGLPAPEQVSARDAEPYRTKLLLDFIGQPTISAGVTEFGGFVGGSGSAFFSDMLGDRALGVAAQVSGKLADFGGELVYWNRRHRWNWAAALSVLPYRLGYVTYREDPAAGEVRLSEIIERQTSRGAFGVAAYPFSTATRLEVSAGVRSLSFTRDARVRVYSSTSRELVDRFETTEKVAESLHLAETNVAFVRDTSFFGATGPLFGTRARLELGRTAGTINYGTVLADWRRYFMPVRPLTVAVRGVQIGR
jgi:hypothetical protein